MNVTWADPKGSVTLSLSGQLQSTSIDRNVSLTLSLPPQLHFYHSQTSTYKGGFTRGKSDTFTFSRTKRRTIHTLTTNREKMEFQVAFVALLIQGSDENQFIPTMPYQNSTITHPSVTLCARGEVHFHRVHRGVNDTLGRKKVEHHQHFQFSGWRRGMSDTLSSQSR